MFWNTLNRKPKSVELASDDTTIVRAKKIIRLMGMVGATGDITLKLAECLEAYQKLDKEDSTPSEALPGAS